MAIVWGDWCSTWSNPVDLSWGSWSATWSNPVEPSYVHRVVHIRHPEATNWDYGTSYYGDYVSQAAVNDMVDAGVMSLTGAATVAEAWQELIPSYSSGTGIAIKASFNNTWECNPTHLNIDALIQVVNAMIRGIKLAYPSLDNDDIWVYEAAQVPAETWGYREISTRFKNGCLYSGVRFYDYSCSAYSSTYNSTDPSADIVWNNPGSPDPPAMQVVDVLVNATYVIDMPIMKRHWAAGITGALKNHMGSIADPQSIHDWVYPSGSYYSSTYNPIVDLYLNSNIGDKTVLVVMDGLFGNWEDNNTKPKPWTTFGNGAPNSLLFAVDPVAIDSVMADILDDEYALDATARDVLSCADTAGLGVYETSPYSEIDYEYIYMSGRPSLFSVMRPSSQPRPIHQLQL